jgi:hypothetical protein
MRWQWLWMGGWITGYGTHWAATTRSTWALPFLLLVASGALPLAARALATRRARAPREG